MTLFEQVKNNLDNKNMEALKSLINEADILEVVELIKELPSEEKVIVFRLLNKEKALEVFEQLDVELQQKLISSFKEDRAIELISGMEPDDRVRLLDELPARVAKKLLSSLSLEEREKTNELMGYSPRTAGRIMTPEYVRIKREDTVKDALETVRKNGQEKETVYLLYVTDNTRKLEGVVSLRELVMASPQQKVEDIMTQNLANVSIDTDQEEVARLLQDLDLLAVPVVDRENRLVGIITVDDAMDIIDEETTDDIFDKAGLTALAGQETGRSLRLVTGSMWQVWLVRLPFLVITLIGGLTAGAVIDVYEDTLGAIPYLAIFIPVIMDMGGNVGTQSSTIFTRAYVLGHISIKHFFRHWLREIGIGLSIGVIMGLVTGIIASVWQQKPELGLTVGIALAITVTLATTLGFLVPFTLVRLGFDQAAGSDPFITTIKDIVSLMVYFYLVTVFMGHLIY